jgi:hypothetical protein
MCERFDFLEEALEAQRAENMRLMEIIRLAKPIGCITVDSENQIVFTPLKSLKLTPGTYAIGLRIRE